MRAAADKYDLLKTASLIIVSHGYIHFGNGMDEWLGYLLTLLMIKYGFNVRTEKLINPTAVFL